MPLYYEIDHKYSNDSFSVFYSHIPKCAGTIVKEYLKNTGLIEILESRDPPFLITSLQHLELNRVSSLIKLENIKYKFAFIRNPYQRFLSEYFYVNQIKYRPNCDQKGIIKQIEEWALRYFKLYKNNLNILDNHLLPQFYFFSDEFKIFKIEDGLSCWKNDYNSIAPKKFTLGIIKDYKMIEYDINLISPKTLNVIDKIYKNDLEYYR